jgi:hypothetical protein
MARETRQLRTLLENKMVIAGKDFKLAADAGIADVNTTCAFKILNWDGVGPDLTAPPTI